MQPNGLKIFRGENKKSGRLWTVAAFSLVPETGIEPVRPLLTKRRILSPLCLPISPLGPNNVGTLIVKQKRPLKGAQLQSFTIL